MKTIVKIYTFGPNGLYGQSEVFTSHLTPSEKEMITEQIKFNFPELLGVTFVYKAVDMITGEKQIRLVEK